MEELNPKGASIVLGGSTTLNETGLMEAIKLEHSMLT